jgi:hypothetical protein
MQLAPLHLGFILMHVTREAAIRHEIIKYILWIIALYFSSCLKWTSVGNFGTWKILTNNFCRTFLKILLLFDSLLGTVNSTSQLQFDISANAFVIRAVQSPKWYSPKWDRWVSIVWCAVDCTSFYTISYHSRLISKKGAEVSQVFLREPTPTFYQNDLAMRNTADVTGGKPIAVWLVYLRWGCC